MRRVWCQRWLVVALFCVVTLGNALPYAVAYQQVHSKQITCHCCDHGAIECPHCKKFGHQGESSKQVGRTQKTYRTFPCKNTADSDSLDFSTKQFVLKRVRFFSGKRWVKSISEKRKISPFVSEKPSVPPPRFTV